MGLFDYFKTLWEDVPSHDSPLKADNLNNLENGVKQANDGLNALVDPSGLIFRSKLPNVAGVIDYAGIANQAAMLALTAPDASTQLRVLRTDTPGVQWVLNAGLTASTFANWLQEPFDASGAAAAAQAASVQKTGNLGDVADPGAARYNLQVAALGDCQAVAAGNIARSGTPTIDGYVTHVGDRVLCAGQSVASQNGPWVVASGSWTRPTDYPTGGTVKARTVQVVNGTVNGGTQWSTSPSSPATVDTTATAWSVTNSGAYVPKAGGPVTGPLLLSKGPVIDVASLISDPADGATNHTTLTNLFTALSTDDSYAGRRVKFTPKPGTGGANIKVAGSILVAAMSGLEISGDDAMLEQTSAGVITLDVAECPDLHIEGLRFRGKGTEIAGTSGASTSWNGVAGLHLKSWARASLERLYFENHAGGSLRWNRVSVGDQVQTMWADQITAVGVGTSGGIAAGDNRSDFAVSDTGQVYDGPMADMFFSRLVLSQHSIGLGLDYVNQLHIDGAHIFDIIGQHGIYADHCPWGSIRNVDIERVGLCGVKYQIRSTGPGVDNFTMDNVKVDTAGQNGWAIGYVDGTQPYRVKKAKIHHCEVKNVAQDGAALFGLVGAELHHNTIETCGRYGYFVQSFSGAIEREKIIATQQAGIFGYIADYTKIEKCDFIDVALNAGAGAGAAFTTHVDLLRDPTVYAGSGVAVAATNPIVEIGDNVHRQGRDSITGTTTAEPATLTALYATTSDLKVGLTRPRNYTTKSATSGVTNLTYYDAGTIVPILAGMPALNGMLGWSIDPASSALVAQTIPSAGVLDVTEVIMLAGGPVTKVTFYVSTAGTGLTAGQCWVLVYDSGGNLIGQAAAATAFGSTSGGTGTAVTLASPTATQAAGALIRVATVWNGTTGPALRGVSGSGVPNLGLTAAATSRRATAGSGITTTPPTTLPTLTAAFSMPSIAVS